MHKTARMEPIRSSGLMELRNLCPERPWDALDQERSLSLLLWSWSEIVYLSLWRLRKVWWAWQYWARYVPVADCYLSSHSIGYAAYKKSLSDDPQIKARDALFAKSNKLLSLQARQRILLTKTWQRFWRPRAKVGKIAVVVIILPSSHLNQGQSSVQGTDSWSEPRDISTLTTK